MPTRNSYLENNAMLSKQLNSSISGVVQDHKKAVVSMHVLILLLFVVLSITLMQEICFTFGCSLGCFFYTGSIRINIHVRNMHVERSLFLSDEYIHKILPWTCNFQEAPEKCTHTQELWFPQETYMAVAIMNKEWNLGIMWSFFQTTGKLTFGELISQQDLGEWCILVLRIVIFLLCRNNGLKTLT